MALVGDRALLEKQADQGPALLATRKPVPMFLPTIAQSKHHLTAPAVACQARYIHRDQCMVYNVLIEMRLMSCFARFAVVLDPDCTPVGLLTVVVVTTLPPLTVIDSFILWRGMSAARIQHRFRQMDPSCYPFRSRDV
ncbi:hypothetical protein GE21DRAFT_2961 [Neurospora crassa]|uniref:Uncharacterized protein n=2 Tax=Neurospora crassa TaxID=5141 RepID=Q1K8K9_NEUCR|nr:hypothetical protein NCU05370 [Neurospora crassa OR74A]EAA34125.1 hypothetical protein NCU05370 [Neurospora crassa OR74A]KHE85340.1 hypothetical protein GE21DRAFT_2961 [Neurospora crassa]CAB91310.2 hypothetical protein [Neurospora crassa]|eukprot:XP_963361.1 hypothetical protein NCU05370 [Neurospora crassa OR74A]